MRLQATVVGHSLSVPAGASIPHMPTTDGPAFRLATALAIGLLMGAERERRKGEGPQRSPAGIRTFAVAALLGGVSYRLGGGVLLAVTTLALAGFCAVAYWRGHDKDPGLTSETALLLAALLGGLAQVEIAIASGIAVVVTILLAARTPGKTVTRVTDFMNSGASCCGKRGISVLRLRRGLTCWSCCGWSRNRPNSGSPSACHHNKASTPARV